MTADKHPMQADGQGTKRPSADEAEVASRKGGAGESGGGAYPNPWSGKPRKRKPFGSFLGHGGQSHINYEGSKNPNATTEKEDD